MAVLCQLAFSLLYVENLLRLTVTRIDSPAFGFHLFAQHFHSHFYKA